LNELVSDPARAKKMGMQGHDHVKSKFGLDVFRQRWRGLVGRAIVASRGNIKKYGGVGCASMPLLALLLAFVVYFVAQYISPSL